MAFDAVIFDWRGTLVTTLTEDEWVTLALAAVGLPGDAVRPAVDAIEAANGAEDRLDAPGVDSDALLRWSDLRVDPSVR